MKKCRASDLIVIIVLKKQRLRYGNVRTDF